MSNLAQYIEYLERLNERLIHGDIVDVALMPSAVSMVFSIKRRVSTQGVASDGSKMRAYSTTPMYASRSQFVGGGFNPQGKNNVDGLTIGDRLIPTVRTKKTGVKRNPTKYNQYTAVKPNYQERKSMYLKDGYKELRDVQGLRTDVTNMKYSGKLLEDFWLERDGDVINIGLTSQRSADVYNGQAFGTGKMKGRGAFLLPTQQEKEKYLKETSFIITRVTRNILEGYDLTATLS